MKKIILLFWLSCILSGCQSEDLLFGQFVFCIGQIAISVILFVWLSSQGKRTVTPEDYFGDSYKQNQDSQEQKDNLKSD